MRITKYSTAVEFPRLKRPRLETREKRKNSVRPDVQREWHDGERGILIAKVTDYFERKKADGIEVSDNLVAHVRGQVAQLVNELLDNAYWHGNEADPAARILFEWEISEHENPKNDTICIRVGDTGNGGEKVFSTEEAMEYLDNHDYNGLFGLQLVAGMTDSATSRVLSLRLKPDDSTINHIVEVTRGLLTRDARGSKLLQITPEHTAEDCA